MFQRTKNEVDEIVRVSSVVLNSRIDALRDLMGSNMARISEDLDTLDDDLSTVQQLREDVEELAVNMEAYRLASLAVGEVVSVLFDRLTLVEAKAEVTIYRQNTLIRDLRNNGQAV